MESQILCSSPSLADLLRVRKYENGRFSGRKTVVSAAETAVSAAETAVSDSKTAISESETAVSDSETASETVVSESETAVSDSETDVSESETAVFRTLVPVSAARSFGDFHRKLEVKICRRRSSVFCDLQRAGTNGVSIYFSHG